jgi:hypothetical protein
VACGAPERYQFYFFRMRCGLIQIANCDFYFDLQPKPAKLRLDSQVIIVAGTFV